MHLTNKEVFEHDPTKGDIPNLGVAKVKNPEDSGDWATLEWELRSFVCEGEYERGLERILDQFLSHLSQAEQPAAWVSGFFGSGKSHLMRVLEYLWRDYTLPSGASARALAELPPDIERHLAELSTAGKREGGLWSAAGTLGSGAAGSARLAFLSVIFDAAGLPRQYGPAALAIRLKTEGSYNEVATSVRAAGKSLDHELRNLYVSPVLAQALIDAGASFGDTPAAVSTALQAQHPPVEDISNAEMLDTFEQVLRLQSERAGKLPLTLIVLDEMQQYVSDDSDRSEDVRELVESCATRFSSQVLVVATGQAALSDGGPALGKLMDRFPVQVALSDTDVETVVRKVVLRKKPDAHAAIDDVLAKASGEIDRHLGGTRLAAKAADKPDLVADYPLLPTRRRFWERALRAIDKAGKAGVLRTQLKIVHEAARTVADRPLGHVIGGDFVFHSEAASMLASGALLKEIDELIRGLDDGTPDGTLKSRACALVFLISELPTGGIGDTGLRATAPAIEDLLVEDLVADGARLRKDVARVLDELADEGRVVKLGDEYRLQTEEGALWTKDYNQRRAAVRDDAARISQLRNEWLTKLLDKELAGIKRFHGDSKETRKFDRHTGDDAPVATGANIPVWIRDEWNVTEASVRAEAAAAGTDSSIVFALLPKLDPEAIRNELASLAAATDAIDQRPEPQTNEGRQAKQGMQSRAQQSDEDLNRLFSTLISKASVFQGGGNELTTSTLRTGIEAAGDHSLARLFPKFKTADNPGWDKVITKARDGAASLTSVGWSGAVPANPVCKEVLARITGGGTKGSDLHRDLSDPPYGWPKDAVDGAVLALLANGNIRAAQDGQPVGGAKELPRTQIGKAVLYKEDDPPSTTERLAVRGLLAKAAVPYTPDQEGAAISGLLQHLVELAQHAGGAAPLPAPPSTEHLAGLSALAGNEQFRAVAAAAQTLLDDLDDWTKSGERRSARETAWAKLDRLLAHADGLAAADEATTQRQAILDSRLLLAGPDPIAPLIAKLGDALRVAVEASAQEAQAARAAAIAELEASDEWQNLDPAAREPLLVGAGLKPIATPAVTTHDDLLQALDSVSLPSWRERCQALPAKAAAVRAAAAKQLEPKSVAVKPPTATIKTPADVDAYLGQLREILMRHVDADETVIL